MQAAFKKHGVVFAEYDVNALWKWMDQDSIVFGLHSLQSCDLDVSEYKRHHDHTLLGKKNATHASGH